MTCLGDVVAALVDGELDHAARERAQRHLAHCGPCRAEVDAQRRLKARLTGDAVEPALSAALTARLLAVRFLADCPPTSTAPRRTGPRVLIVPPAELGHDTQGPGTRGRPRLRPSGRRRAVASGRGPSRPAPPGTVLSTPGPAGPAASGTASSGSAPSGPVPSGPAPAVGRRRGRRLRRTAAVGSAVAVLGVALVLGGPPATGPSTPVDPGTPAFVGVFVNSTSGQPTGTSSAGGGRSQR